MWVIFLVSSAGVKREVPVVTLYTKNPCPLCELLKEELAPFEGQFVLEQVDIEENEQFRKLYRYEIPVVFLNGRFLCKHRVDIKQFERRLRAETVGH